MTTSGKPDAHSRQQDSRDFLAIIFIGCGSSWARAGTSLEAIEQAKKACEIDWGSIFTFSDEPALINVFDAEGVNGWRADHRGLVSDDGQPLQHLFTATAKLKNRKR